MYIRKETNPYYANRIDKDEVTRLYQQREQYTISLNDQLEKFYNKCKNNRLYQHEVTYFFHAECLSGDELKQYQTKFHKNLKQRYNEDIAKAKELMQNKNFRVRLAKRSRSRKLHYRSHNQKLEKSKISDYRLYGGVRATLVFYPRWGIPLGKPHWGLPNNAELKILCEEIEPMMYTQLWRKWNPINIPVSTIQIKVIGFEKHDLLEDEDDDIGIRKDQDSFIDNLNLLWSERLRILTGTEERRKCLTK